MSGHGSARKSGTTRNEVILLKKIQEANKEIRVLGQEIIKANDNQGLLERKLGIAERKIASLERDVDRLIESLATAAELAQTIASGRRDGIGETVGAAIGRRVSKLIPGLGD